MGRHLSSDPRAIVDRQHVFRRLAINRQLATRTRDLSAVLLTRGHHAAAEKLRDLAVVEVHDAGRVVLIIVLAQLRADGSNPDGRDGLDL